jgi:hypothetical protein
MTKREAMTEVNEFAQTDAGRAFRKLVSIWINDLRAKNDTAESEDFMKNQGAIRELKLIHKGIGPKIRTEDYDGGFGA